MDGIALAEGSRAMTSFFMAGSELVHWELTALGRSGPYKLSIRHAHGTIVEYFTTTAAALYREQELEALFLASSIPAPATAWAS